MFLKSSKFSTSSFYSFFAIELVSILFHSRRFTIFISWTFHSFILATDCHISAVVFTSLSLSLSLLDVKLKLISSFTSSSLSERRMGVKYIVAIWIIHGWNKETVQGSKLSEIYFARLSFNESMAVNFSVILKVAGNLWWKSCWFFLEWKLGWDFVKIIFIKIKSLFLKKSLKFIKNREISNFCLKRLSLFKSSIFHKSSI